MRAIARVGRHECDGYEMLEAFGKNPDMNSGRWTELKYSTMVLAILSSFACGHDATGPSTSVAVDQYWNLHLNYHAVTLALTAPANHLRLVALPLTAAGTPLSTTARTTFTSSDSSVLVDSTGLLTAHSANTNVRIIASMTITNARGQAVTLQDTAKVNVTDVAPVPVFTRLIVHTPGDSAKAAYGLLNTVLSDSALDASSLLINTVQFDHRSSDTSVVSFQDRFNGRMRMKQPGVVWLYVTTTIYGITITDSLRFTVGWQVYTVLGVDTVVSASDSSPKISVPTLLTIGPGGIVRFINRSGRTVDFVFDDPSAVRGDTLSVLTRLSTYGIFDFSGAPKLPTSAGNVLLPPALGAGFPDGIGIDERLFPHIGTYAYHSTSFPSVQGVIQVRGNEQ